jgi:hypothetical protein
MQARFSNRNRYQMKQKCNLLLLILLLSFCSGIAQVEKSPFAEDLKRFRELDSISPPPPHATLFIGSSSFTLWKDVQSYFPGYIIINRAYGGSRLLDLNKDFNEIVPPYNPKQVVIYCGENDFASADTLAPVEVTSRFKQLFNQIRKKFPNVNITYVSMKPSPSRWYMHKKFIVANRGIRKFLNKQPNTSYIDVWHKMLGKNHKPLAGIFIQDQLHMNSSGYQIWQKAIQPYLLK